MWYQGNNGNHSVSVCYNEILGSNRYLNKSPRMHVTIILYEIRPMYKRVFSCYEFRHHSLQNVGLEQQYQSPSAVASTDTCFGNLVITAHQAPSVIHAETSCCQSGAPSAAALSLGRGWSFKGLKMNLAAVTIKFMCSWQPQCAR